MRENGWGGAWLTLSPLAAPGGGVQGAEVGAGRCNWVGVRGCLHMGVLYVWGGVPYSRSQGVSPNYRRSLIRHGT